MMTPSTKIPAIAIHGVGTHKLGDIRDALELNLSKASGFDLQVYEFNWDQYVDHSTWRNPRGALWSLQTTSFDIQAAGLVGIIASENGADEHLSRLQLFVCNVLRYVVAFFLALFVAFPALVLMVFLPSILVQISSAFPTDGLSWFMRNVVPIAIQFIGGVCATIVLLGSLRCFVQRSLVPLRASIVGVALMVFNPLLVLISVPFSLPWAGMGLTVGLVSVAGLIFLLLNWLLPDAGPVFSVWDDYSLAPYFFWVIIVLVVLQSIHTFLERGWFEGPIKVVLDIFRYLAEPDYRRETLSRLEKVVAAKAEDAQTVVLVAHSLGSVIAIDYLLNWTDGDPKRDVWLVTLGSPYRRFFQSLFPRILFHRNTNVTANAIARKFQSFHWLNIYRPWDPIGKSLKLQRASAGLDVSTRQYRKVNGHPDYWSDPIIMESATQAFVLVAEPSARSRDESPPNIPAIMHLTSPSNNWLGITHFLFIGLGVAWMIFSIADQASQIEDIQQRVDQQGLHVDNVFVTHQRIPDAAGQQLYAHQFNFISASASDIPTIQLSPFLPASRAQQLFDYRKLIEHIRLNCELEREDTWYTAEDFIPCTSNEPVELSYLPGMDNPVMHLPNFEANTYLRDVDGWILFPLALFFFLSIPGLPFTMLTAGVFLVFLGRRVDDKLGNTLKEFE